MRHHLALSVGLIWVVLSAILAILIRDNFAPYIFCNDEPRQRLCRRQAAA